MLYVIASGAHLETDRVDRFGKQIDEIYANPYDPRKRKRQPYTAAEIKEYLICRLEGREWI